MVNKNDDIDEYIPRKSRNCDYFKIMNKKDVINILADREQKGTLLAFIKVVAPDYVSDKTVLSFSLMRDLILGEW